MTLYLGYAMFHVLTHSAHERGLCIMLGKHLDEKLVSKHSSKDERLLLLNVK